MKVWDSQKMADMVARKGLLQEKLAVVSDAMHQEYNSDGWASDDGSKKSRYDLHFQEHSAYSAEINQLDREISNLENYRPSTVKAKQALAITRFFKRGHNGLEADEIKFQDEYGDEEAAVMAGPGYERFVITPETDGSMHAMPGAQRMANDGDTDATRSDDTSGSTLNPQTTRPSVIDALKYYGGISRMAYNFSTGEGNELRMPYHDDTSQEGELLATQNKPVDTMAGGKLGNFDFAKFDALTMSSKPIYLTREMLNDSIIDIASFANARVVRRMGRGWDKEFMTEGTRPINKGTSAAVTKPTGMLGILTCALIKSNKSAASKKIAHGDLVNAIYDVERAYREGSENGEGGLMAEMGGKVGFLISDEVEKILSSTTDSDGRPLWLPAWTSSIAPSPRGATILGYPYEVGSNLPALAANSRSWMFGNFSYYGIRTVAAIEVFRFQDSRTMQRNAIEILGFSRRFARPMVEGAVGADPDNSGKFAFLGIPQIVLQQSK